ncbi:(Fe-S)-binding protein [Candidatus Bathyarchaeota archaeon]|nr:(Fe-S)-binding protein [Candidatus Bathyarchaeota archaeon]
MTSNIQENIKAALGQFSRKQLMELDTCSHCALCTEMCPAYNSSKDSLHAPGVRTSKAVKLYDKKFSLWSKIFGEKEITQKEMDDLAESAYHCTLCGRCRESCPFGFETHELWIRIREIVEAMGTTPENVARLSNMLDENMNPYGQDPDTRLDWSFYVDIDEVPEEDEADIAYFIGCTTAYKGANHEVAFSISKILESLDVSWTVLGEDEWCCGAPSMMAGKAEEAKKYAEHNVKMLEDRKVKKVITGCAGCFRSFKFEYPALLGRKPNFEIQHSVEFLRDQLAEGKLDLEKGDETIIYHDPCELGRLSGIIKEPREALSYLTSNQIEFDENGIDSKCCGGGGLLQGVNNDMRLDIVKIKLEEALAKNADILVSACPACKLAFVDGAREHEIELEIRDIHEIVAKRFGVLEE